MNRATSMIAIAAMLLATSCGGGGGSIPAPPPPTPTPTPPPTTVFTPPAQVALSVANIQQILAQGVAEAQARGIRATFAVTDRVGNVLAVFVMNGANLQVDVPRGSKSAIAHAVLDAVAVRR